MTDVQKLEGKVAVDTVVTPGPGAISWKQVGTGLLLAVVSAVFPILIQSFNAGTFTIDWKTIGTVAASTALTYILKKFTDPTQQITTFKKP